MEFRRKYDEHARDWGGSLSGFLLSFEKTDEVDDPRTKPLLWYFEYFIGEMKKNGLNPDGTISGGYEPYEKTIKRMREFCEANHVCFDSLTLADVTPQFVNTFLEWIANRGRGKCLYVSASLRALLTLNPEYNHENMVKYL